MAAVAAQNSRHRLAATQPVLYSNRPCANSSRRACLCSSRRACSCCCLGAQEPRVAAAEREQQQPRLAAVVAAGLFAACAPLASHAVDASDAAAAEAAAAAAAVAGPVDPASYVPGPVEVGWQLWFAAIVSTVPFVIGAYEFGKRILIQRRCKVCGGNGLVQKGRFQRKCPECGGFFPWISWRMFLSANARPGNGGPLLQPRGQTSVFYAVPPPLSEAELQQQQQAAEQECTPEVRPAAAVASAERARADPHSQQGS